MQLFVRKVDDTFTHHRKLLYGHKLSAIKCGIDSRDDIAFLWWSSNYGVLWHFEIILIAHTRIKNEFFFCTFLKCFFSARLSERTNEIFVFQFLLLLSVYEPNTLRASSLNCFLLLSALKIILCNGLDLRKKNKETSEFKKKYNLVLPDVVDNKKSEQKTSNEVLLRIYGRSKWFFI